MASNSLKFKLPFQRHVSLIQYPLKGKVNHYQAVKSSTTNIHYSLLDSLVVECCYKVREVQGSIPSQGPRHTKHVIKMVTVVPLLSTQH